MSPKRTYKDYNPESLPDDFDRILVSDKLKNALKKKLSRRDFYFGNRYDIAMCKWLKISG